MTNQFKKIIAREGLIIIGCIIIGVMAYYMIPYFPYSATPIPPHELTMFELICKYRGFMGVFSYFLSWVIRFIVWAIATLGAKE